MIPVSHDERSHLKGHHPAILWFTGLSGSGKTTIARSVDRRLYQASKAHTYLLDGDVLRSGLNRDLGFTQEDRVENIRRVGEVSRLLWDAGLVVLVALISPFRAERQRVRSLFTDHSFFEIYVCCPLAICEQRDPKGLYKKARSGLIPEFTGITSPYEEPLNPDLILDTSMKSLDDCTQAVLDMLYQKNVLQGMNS